MKFQLVFLAALVSAAPVADRGDDEFPGGIIRVSPSGRPLRKVGDDWMEDTRPQRQVINNGDGTGRRVTIDADGVPKKGQNARIVTFPPTL